MDSIGRANTHRGAPCASRQHPAQPLVFQLDPSDPTQAGRRLSPVRNEMQATMTLRLVLDNGTDLVTRSPGGRADPGLRAPEPAATFVAAVPGRDLNTLANTYGTVHLTAGK